MSLFSLSCLVFELFDWLTSLLTTTTIMTQTRRIVHQRLPNTCQYKVWLYLHRLALNLQGEFGDPQLRGFAIHFYFQNLSAAELQHICQSYISGYYSTELTILMGRHSEQNVNERIIAHLFLSNLKIIAKFPKEDCGGLLTNNSLTYTQPKYLASNDNSYLTW